MKSARLAFFAFAVAVALGLPVVSWAQGGTATPGAGIALSAHDFTGTGGIAPANLNLNPAIGTVGLCTFCHTPHKALSTLLLWNHRLSANVFKWDVLSTTAGTPFPTISGATYNGPTAKCLSCHDGSVAIGDIAWYKELAWNTPTTLGGPYPGGLPQGGGVASPWMMGMNDGTGNVNTNQFLIGQGGVMAGNHPVAMPYPYTQVASTYNGVAEQIPPAGTLNVKEFQADPTTVAPGAANIRLFVDNGGGSIAAGKNPGNTGIECSTCHDPHNKQAVDGWFLRGHVDGSTAASGYLCLQCHIK